MKSKSDSNPIAGKWIWCKAILSPTVPEGQERLRFVCIVIIRPKKFRLWCIVFSHFFKNLNFL
jgi:7-keto-8-aminopelargonate synthetase-like enzyme